MTNGGNQGVFILEKKDPVMKLKPSQKSGYSHNSWQKKNSKDQRLILFLQRFGCFLYTTIFRQIMRKNDREYRITDKILSQN